MKIRSTPQLLGALFLFTSSALCLNCAGPQSGAHPKNCTDPHTPPAATSAPASELEASSAPATSVPVPAALASWNDKPAKQAILNFVSQVTQVGGPHFVPTDERIAVFDNDGTLWVEKPMYTQLSFTLDRVKELSVSHPEWKKQQPFRAVLENDVAALSKLGLSDLFKLIAATHGGTTSDEFQTAASQWFATSKHPQLKRPYTELVYQPMLELLDFLRQNDFKIYIVSGGGVEFMRAFAQEVYGIPPEQVIGSTLVAKYETLDANHPAVRATGELLDANDGPIKAVSIERIIGRRPILAIGNSDGDYEMLDWSTSGSGLRLGMIVHHTDEIREFAYDRESSVGKLKRGLDDAAKQGWTLIDMKNDWKQIFPGPEQSPLP